MSRLASTGSRSADLTRQILTVVAVLVTITVNALANILPINGHSTASISDSFQVFFVPAGYVFSIWGIIYLGMIAYAVFQALPSQRENRDLRAIGWVFIVSCIANSAWIFFWHYELFPLTVVAMLTLLACLIIVYLRLDVGRKETSTAERWLVHIPMSLYLSWITVATIANVTDVLSWLGWDGWGISGETWAIIMLAAAALIASLIGITRRDIAYIAVIVWAFVGIVVKQADAPSVAIAAGVAAALVAAVLVVSFFIRPGRPSLRAA